MFGMKVIRKICFGRATWNAASDDAGDYLSPDAGETEIGVGDVVWSLVSGKLFIVGSIDPVPEDVSGKVWVEIYEINGTPDFDRTWAFADQLALVLKAGVIL